MLDKVRKRLDAIIEATSNKELLDKYMLIRNIIAYDDSFIHMDVETAICILMDLNYSEDKARDIYLELLKEEYGWNIQAS